MENTKEHRLVARCEERTRERLSALAARKRVSKSEILRVLIDRAYEALRRRETEKC